MGGRFFESPRLLSVPWCFFEVYHRVYMFGSQSARVCLCDYCEHHTLSDHDETSSTSPSFGTDDRRFAPGAQPGRSGLPSDCSDSPVPVNVSAGESQTNRLRRHPRCSPVFPGVHVSNIKDVIFCVGTVASHTSLQIYPQTKHEQESQGRGRGEDNKLHTSGNEGLTTGRRGGGRGDGPGADGVNSSRARSGL